MLNRKKLFNYMLIITSIISGVSIIILQTYNMAGSNVVLINNFEVFTVLFILSFFLIGVIPLYLYLIRGRVKKSITVDSRIVSAVPVMDNDKMKALDICFEDGRSFLVDVYGDLDLTVNSKLILKICRYFYFGEPESDYWFIDSIIKVPSN